MRAACYIRVSTDDQVREGFSIPAQREKLTAYAVSQDWDIYDYYVDEGYSAKDTKRPEFQRMMKDAQEKQIDVILVYKLDRFTRNVRDLYDVLDRLSKLNVSFRSSQEQFDTTTTMGRAMIGMLGIFAQWEREVIADRVYFGMEQKITSGKRNGAIAPLGFDLVEGKLVKNQDAEFVKRIFSMYLSGMGMPSLNESLALEGKSMHIKTLWYILKNPIYCGEYRWRFRSKGRLTHNPIVVDAENVEPIISKEEFYRVQSMIKSRDKKGRAATSDYLFSGIVKCARCGFPLTGGIRHNKESDILFYRCSGRVGYGKCDLPRIREESVVEALFTELNIDKRSLSKKVKTVDKKVDKQDYAKVMKEIDQIRKRREKWRSAFANDLISMEELRKYTDIEKEKEQVLLRKYEEAKSEAATFRSVEETYKLFKDISVAFNAIDDRQAKKMFLNDIFREITINTEVTRPRAGRKNEYGCHITDWKLVE
ncbi:recombinase family protein [Cohnella sp. GCM10027633]|uniref:recombinase family protein n=1 Tax=unclassified Cohnella TaxID=2636738 RepID=UPI003628DA00